MIIRTLTLLIACLALGACASNGSVEELKPRMPALESLVVGESFTIDSKIMAEPRHINVFIPTVYGQKFDVPLPVLYMLDGGIDEDFLHVAGLIQVLVSNGGMRPFMLVGIQNTSRRRDMTGPTTNAEDKKIAAVVGGSATFRRFIKEELMPTVKARYKTTQEAAIIGESLAGLFAVETFFLEPELFSTFVAIDPSLWWADQELLKVADARLASKTNTGTSMFVASSSEPEILKQTAELAATFKLHPKCGTAFRYMPFPQETHATIYHPAALQAFRAVFAPHPAAAH